MFSVNGCYRFLFTCHRHCDFIPTQKHSSTTFGIFASKKKDKMSLSVSTASSRPSRI
ncbi:Uncharacterized protein APZ42_020906 [Daphnia magna]|uniref:Uncharacterized protein n=1 Tax=Daphnia magna TaxID=35525 RepID=A0A164X4T1_9CRUS|nr:Uncharacterized protein APZ42_020906 [Daphnia magna]